MPILISRMTKWKSWRSNLCFSLVDFCERGKFFMRILGIDPGLYAAGYGVVDVTPYHQVQLVEVGTIQPKKRDPFPHRLIKVYKNLEDIIVQFHPDVMVVEELYSHYKHPATAAIMGHARGVILLLSAQRKLPVVEYGVKRIRKALMGNGSATKEQTRDSVCHILKIDASQLPLDASDALALALGYAFMQRFKTKIATES